MAKVNANVEVSELLLVSGFAVAGALCFDHSCNDGKALKFLKEKLPEIKQWFAGGGYEGSEAKQNTIRSGIVMKKKTAVNHDVPGVGVLTQGKKVRKNRDRVAPNAVDEKPHDKVDMRKSHDDADENAVKPETAVADGPLPVEDVLPTPQENHNEAEASVQAADVEDQNEQEPEGDKGGVKQPEQAE